MNKTIKVMGTVKSNKNETNYIDMPEGRVFLGKVSGFKAGDKINGTAVCKEQVVNYPAQAAVGVEGQPGYRPATAASTENAWSCVNFISRELVAQDKAYEAAEAKADFTLAVIKAKTAKVATFDNVEDLMAIPV